MAASRKPWLYRLSLPVRVGLAFAIIAMLLAVIGIIRGNVPANPLSIFLALLISGGSWGVVSWAVTTAVVDVERDIGDETAAGGAATDAERGGAVNDESRAANGR